MDGSSVNDLVIPSATSVGYLSTIPQVLSLLPSATVASMPVPDAVAADGAETDAADVGAEPLFIHTLAPKNVR